MVTGIPRITRIPDDRRYDEREILRYAGVRSGPADQLPLAECLSLADGLGSGRVVWQLLPIVYTPDSIAFGTVRTESRALRTALDGCSHAVLFAATLGIGFDQLIARYRTVSPSRALLLHAIGAERIERVCDRFTDQLKTGEGLRLRPRFSPGYGDWPLEAQKEIFSLLDCGRKIGLTLNASLIMSPSKSVTAVAGIERQEDELP